MTTQTVRDAPPRAISEHKELTNRIKKAGLLQRRTRYYAVRIISTVVLFAGGWAALALISPNWWSVLIIAVFLSVISMQSGFLGHDAGHKQVCSNRKANYRVGLLLGDLMLGMSIGWWTFKHNMHHAFPNTEGLDGDIAPGPLVHTRAAAGERNWAGRLLSRSQAFLFFPMLTLEGVNLHVASFRAMFGGTIKTKRMRTQETSLLLLHLALYLGAVFYLLTPVQALVFIAVHQGLFGIYLGISFAPNHKGMPVLTKAQAEELGHVRLQVLTARNIRGGWFIDWLLGGLNYQIEHHLFPNMPRPWLKLAQPIIRAFCAEIEVEYTEVGFFASYGAVLGHLYRVGRKLGRRNRGTNA